MQVGLEVVESSSYYFVCKFIILFSGVYSHVGMQTIKLNAEGCNYSTYKCNDGNTPEVDIDMDSKFLSLRTYSISIYGVIICFHKLIILFG